MKKVKINTKNAPQAIGSYEQAIVVGNMVYTSGQIGLTTACDVVGECVKQQTNQAMQNLVAVIEAAGSDMSKVIKTTLFIKDMSEFKVIDEVYKSFFNENYPARSCVEVSELPRGLKFEIEAVAYI